MGSTTVGISSTVGEETTTSDGQASTTIIGDPTEKTTTDGEGSTTPAGETTPDPCTDKDGEEFCLTKIDKCDKPNIVARCEKTCGQCPKVETTVASTTMEVDSTTMPSNNETTTAGIANLMKLIKALQAEVGENK